MVPDERNQSTSIMGRVRHSTTLYLTRKVVRRKYIMLLWFTANVIRKDRRMWLSLGIGGAKPGWCLLSQALEVRASLPDVFHRQTAQELNSRLGIRFISFRGVFGWKGSPKRKRRTTAL